MVEESPYSGIGVLNVHILTYSSIARNINFEGHNLYLQCCDFPSTLIDMLKHSVQLPKHCFQFKYLELQSN